MNKQLLKIAVAAMALTSSLLTSQVQAVPAPPPPVIKIDDRTETATVSGTAMGSLITPVNTTLGVSGPLNGAELVTFAGTFNGGGTHLLPAIGVLTEPGTGTGRDAIVSDVFAWNILPRFPLPNDPNQNTRITGGFFLSLEEGAPTVTVGNLLSAITSLPGRTLPLLITTLNGVDIREETGDFQNFTATETALTLSVASGEGVPDGGATIVLTSLGMLALGTVRCRMAK
jgi:hypothetical protein